MVSWKWLIRSGRCCHHGDLRAPALANASLGLFAESRLPTFGGRPARTARRRLSASTRTKRMPALSTFARGRPFPSTVTHAPAMMAHIPSLPFAYRRCQPPTAPVFLYPPSLHTRPQHESVGVAANLSSPAAPRRALRCPASQRQRSGSDGSRHSA